MPIPLIFVVAAFGIAMFAAKGASKGAPTAAKVLNSSKGVQGQDVIGKLINGLNTWWGDITNRVASGSVEAGDPVKYAQKQFGSQLHPEWYDKGGKYDQCDARCKSSGGGRGSLTLGGGCQCKAPQFLKAGTRGNCNWDTKGGWCWKSSACKFDCKACMKSYIPTTTTGTDKGCSQVREYFIRNSRRCPGCVAEANCQRQGMIAVKRGNTLTCAGTTGSFKAGSRGSNCSWDARGGWCWSSTSCGGKCRACRTGYKTTNITQGCNAARTYFLNNAKKCPSCKNNICKFPGCASQTNMGGCYVCHCKNRCKAGGYPGVDRVKADGSCFCNPKPKTSTFKAGSSGSNCSWDAKGGWCWTSSACGGRCKACRTGYRTTNIRQGCNAARSYFLANSKKCPACR